MKQKVVHYNPSGNIYDIEEWTDDVDKVTCKICLKKIAELAAEKV